MCFFHTMLAPLAVDFSNSRLTYCGAFGTQFLRDLAPKLNVDIHSKKEDARKVFPALARQFFRSDLHLTSAAFSFHMVQDGASTLQSLRVANGRRILGLPALAGDSSESESFDCLDLITPPFNPISLMRVSLKTVELFPVFLDQGQCRECPATIRPLVMSDGYTARNLSRGSGEACGRAPETTASNHTATNGLNRLTSDLNVNEPDLKGDQENQECEDAGESTKSERRKGEGKSQECGEADSKVHQKIMHLFIAHRFTSHRSRFKAITRTC